MGSPDSNTDSNSRSPASKQLQYAKGILYSYAGTIIVAIQQITIVPFIVQLFGSQLYGLYVLYLSILSSSTALLGWVSTASAPLLSNYYHKKESLRCKEMYQSLHFLHLAFASTMLFAALCCLLFSEALPSLALIEHPLLFFSAAVYATILIVSGVEATALFASGYVATLNFHRSFSQLVTLLCFFLLFAYLPVYDLLILPHIIGSLLLYFAVRSAFKNLELTDFQDQSPVLKKDLQGLLLKFSSLAGLTSICRTFVMLDPVLLLLLFNTAVVAEFSYYWLPANFVILALWKFSENVQPFLMEAFANGKFLLAKSIYKRVFLLNSALSIIAACCYCLTIPYFLKFWIDFDNYSLIVALPFAAYIFLASMYRLDFAVFYSKLNYKVLLLMSAAELLIKFLGSILLAPYFSAGTTMAAHVAAHILVLQLCAKLFLRREFVEEEVSQ